MGLLSIYPKTKAECDYEIGELEKALAVGSCSLKVRLKYSLINPPAQTKEIRAHIKALKGHKKTLSK